MSCDHSRRRRWAAVALVLALALPGAARADDDEDDEEMERRGGRGPVLALEIGFGGAAGDGGTIYGPGLGKAFILGYRLGPTTFEWHFSQGYRMAPEQAVLDGERSSGSLGLSTVGVRYSRQRRSYVVSGFLGVTRASIPLLSLVTDEIGDTTVERRELLGVGGVGGIGVAVPVKRGQIQVGLDLRAAYVAWERPGYRYVAEVEPVDDSSATFTEAVGDISAIPWTLAFSMRALL